MPTSFVTISPASGTGTQNLTITASPNTGRSQRQIVFGAIGTNDLPSDNKLAITQQAASPFIRFDTSSQSKDTSGGTALFTGKSNLATIKVTLDAEHLGSSLDSAEINGVVLDSTAKGQLTSTGYTVVGDPGESGEYNVSISITVPSNAGENPVTYTTNVGDGTTNTNILVIVSGSSPTPPPTPTDTIEFTSTRDLDYDIQSGDVSIEITSDGAYKSGESRTLGILASDSSIDWTITPSNS